MIWGGSSGLKYVEKITMPATFGTKEMLHNRSIHKVYEKTLQSGDHLEPCQKNSLFLEVSKQSALAWEMSAESMKLKFKPLVVH